MKKFFTEFKEFIANGSVLDLAVGVIIGGAFKGIVDALIANLINPIIACIGGDNISGFTYQIIKGNEATIMNFGAFLSAIINFIVIAFVIFLIVKSANKAKALAKKNKEEEEEEATTKTCPFCKSEIAIDATKCPHCTADQPEEAE
ncbi:MAG: large conductance mechanosensitive channel protein MscL [Eubacterium sp.]|nr:large conductance mechanosensitive channel protein MscL [Eubacterium sp.]